MIYNNLVENQMEKFLVENAPGLVSQPQTAQEFFCLLKYYRVGSLLMLQAEEIILYWLIHSGTCIVIYGYIIVILLYWKTPNQRKSKVQVCDTTDIPSDNTDAQPKEDLPGTSSTTDNTKRKQKVLG